MQEKSVRVRRRSGKKGGTYYAAKFEEGGRGKEKLAWDGRECGKSHSPETCATVPGYAAEAGIGRARITDRVNTGGFYSDLFQGSSEFRGGKGAEIEPKNSSPSFGIIVASS